MTDNTPRIESQQLARPLTHTILERWEAELRDFFRATRSELAELAEELGAEMPHAPRHGDVATPLPSDSETRAPGGTQSAGEPLDPLQAIKQRLAARLGNA